MVSKTGVALAAAGVVLVAAGGLTKWVAAPALVKVPLDVHVTTVAEGDSQVFVLAQQAVRPVHVVATRTVRGDKSAGTASVAVYDEALCLVAQGTATDALGCAATTDPGFVDKTADRIAFGRKSGLAVADGARFKAAVNGDPAIVHQGLGYTFPIDTRKKSYPFFDTVVGKAFPMAYQDKEKLHGVTVYRFQQTVPDSPITIRGVLPGTYHNVRTVWVEPATGVIVKGSEQILEKFASNGATVFDGTLTFTDKTVGERASYAKSQLDKIHLVRFWLPLAGLVVGVLLLAAGLLLLRRSPQRQPPGVQAVQPESSQT